MTPAEVQAIFRDAGVVRVDGAFTADAAAAMADAVWAYAGDRVGIRRDDPTGWPLGWLPISWRGLKHDPVFDPLLDNDSVLAALDAIFGLGGWTRPKPGAQILFTLPGSGSWVLPDGWHMDGGFERPTWPVFGVKLFAFFGPVRPTGGGTLILPGTHRVVDAYRRGLPAGTGGGMVNWRPFLKHHPFLAQLLTGGSQPDGGRSLLGQVGDVAGVPVEVVELTGKPGDVVITHLHVFHTASPNTTATARQMLGKAIHASVPTRHPDDATD